MCELLGFGAVNASFEYVRAAERIDKSGKHLINETVGIGDKPFDWSDKTARVAMEDEAILKLCGRERK